MVVGMGVEQELQERGVGGIGGSYVELESVYPMRKP